jgi:hypothetical protein
LIPGCGGPTNARVPVVRHGLRTTLSPRVHHCKFAQIELSDITG